MKVERIVERIVGHIDMDAFFASVEERDKPYLRGMPVIIGSDPEEGKGRGVVSTANYKARELGIHSALPIQKAWELCEMSRKTGGVRCVFITSGLGKYRAASGEVFSLIKEYVPIFTQTSIDEAYLDLSFCGSFEDAEKLAKKIKREVQKRLNLSCSIGVAPNKMVAKIASDHKKPNGLTIVRPEEVGGFLKPLSIRAIPGIGKKSEHTFTRLGAKTIQDAHKYSWEELQKEFGKSGFSIWERIRGIDERTIEPELVKKKSIGKHYTFSIDTHDMHEVFFVAREQIVSILKQMKAQGFKEFRTIVLTVRFEDFITVTRSLTMDTAMRNAKDLELKTTKLILPFFEKTENPMGKAIRLIGIRIEKIS